MPSFTPLFRPALYTPYPFQTLHNFRNKKWVKIHLDFELSLLISKARHVSYTIRKNFSALQGIFTLFLEPLTPIVACGTLTFIFFVFVFAKFFDLRNGRRRKGGTSRGLKFTRKSFPFE